MSEPTTTPAAVPASTTTEEKPVAAPVAETSNKPTIDPLEAHFSKKAEPAEAADVPEPAEAPKADSAPPPANPAEQPTVDTADLDQMDLGEKASPNARTNFAKLREIAKADRLARAAAEKQLADFQAQQDALAKAAPQEAAEMERIRTEHKAMADRLALVDLKTHPDYVRQSDVPKNAALAEAKEVLDYNDISSDLDALMGKSLKEFNAEVSKMTKDMNMADTTTVLNALRTAWKINHDATAAISKSGELRQALAEKTALAQKQAVTKVWDSFKQGEALLKSRQAPEGASPEEQAEIAAYNEAVQGLRASYERNAFGQMTEEQTAQMALKSTMFDFLQGHGVKMMERAYKGMEARAIAAEKQVSELKAARSPGNMGGDLPKKAESTPKTLEELFARKAS